MLVAAFIVLGSCSTIEPDVKNPITVSFPTPTVQLTKVSLSDTQQEYVKQGNGMAFRLLNQMYKGDNLVLSPLSLQYALAMTANGASGETLREITNFLGYGADGIDALNVYCKTMLEQLPAVDLDVTLKLADALLVNDRFSLQNGFRETVQDNYYAAVENMDFSDPDQVAATINDWTRRNTNNFIDRIIEPREIQSNAVAFIMNALYFKAKWAGDRYSKMFDENNTKNADFTLSNGTVRKVPTMYTGGGYQYAEMDGYRVLALPYANYKYFMYIILPDENDLEGLVKKLATTSWNSILSSLKGDAIVRVSLPKFDVENKFPLKKDLKALGIKRAFEAGDEFDRMFDNKNLSCLIEEVLQKSRITVAEWGTEAAATTVVEMACGANDTPYRRIDFFADHPFVFLIGERTSGAILFEGTFTGK